MEYPKFKVCCRCFTFNQAKYITDAMNGFTMQQTSFPFVCTIVDDASTDGEQEVIRRYLEENFDFSESSAAFHKETEYAHITYAQHNTNKNCYFAVLYLKENHYSQRKSKMGYLSEWRDMCEYEALCEGDDYWIMPEKLQVQYDMLLKAPNAMMVYTDYQTVDEYGNNILRKQYEIYKRKSISGDILPLLLKANFPLTCTILIRKKIMESSLYKNMPSFYDYGLFLTAASFGDCLYLDKETSSYRNNPNSLINTQQSKVSIGLGMIFKYFAVAYLENKCKKESVFNDLYIKYIISCKTFKINNADSRKFFFQLCQIDKSLLLFIPIVILEKMKRHVCGIETKS